VPCLKIASSALLRRSAAAARPWPKNMPSPPTMRAIKWICITDTSLPAGFAPFGIRDLGGLVYVAFASSSGAAVGLIDIFKENGTFVKRLTHGAPLNQPWRFAAAPSNFGPLSNTLLVSNNTNSGAINGFNATTGQFVGAVKDTIGKVIYPNRRDGRERRIHVVF